LRQVEIETGGREMKTASAKKNGTFGYKAVVIYRGYRTKIPVRHNFSTREEAVAYAQKWIDANDSRPVGVRAQKWSPLAPVSRC
jgi:hypothetical protein